MTLEPSTRPEVRGAIRRVRQLRGLLEAMQARG